MFSKDKWYTAFSIYLPMKFQSRFHTAILSLLQCEIYESTSHSERKICSVGTLNILSIMARSHKQEHRNKFWFPFSVIISNFISENFPFEFQILLLFLNSFFNFQFSFPFPQHFLFFSFPFFHPTNIFPFWISSSQWTKI